MWGFPLERKVLPLMKRMLPLELTVATETQDASRLKEAGIERIYEEWQRRQNVLYSATDHITRAKALVDGEEAEA
jgi:hypothetical protein